MKPKYITIYDLALNLSLSPATVSRGLRDHPPIKKTVRRKNLKLATELGYCNNNFVGNSRKQRTNTIGVIVPHLNSHFMSVAIAGIENVINKEGYNLIISQSLKLCKKEPANVETMFNNRVDGLLVSLSYDTNNLDDFQSFFKKNIPLLFFNKAIDHPSCTSVLKDLAAQNLINHQSGNATMEMTNSIILKSELIIRESSKRKISI